MNARLSMDAARAVAAAARFPEALASAVAACENGDGPRGVGSTTGGLTRSSDSTREGLAMKATRNGPRYVPVEPTTWIEPLAQLTRATVAHLQALDTRPWTGDPWASTDQPPDDGGPGRYIGMCGAILGRTYGPSRARRDRDVTTGPEPVADRCPKCMDALDRRSRPTRPTIKPAEPRPRGRSTPPPAVRLPAEHQLLDINEVAAYLRTTPGTLRYWRHKNTGPRSARIGGRVLYRRSDIEAWVNDQFGD